MAQTCKRLKHFYCSIEQIRLHFKTINATRSGQTIAWHTKQWYYKADRNGWRLQVGLNSRVVHKGRKHSTYCRLHKTPKRKVKVKREAMPKPGNKSPTASQTENTEWLNRAFQKRARDILQIGRWSLARLGLLTIGTALVPHLLAKKTIQNKKDGNQNKTCTTAALNARTQSFWPKYKGAKMGKISLQRYWNVERQKRVFSEDKSPTWGIQTVGLRRELLNRARFGCQTDSQVTTSFGQFTKAHEENRKMHPPTHKIAKT